MMQQRAVLMIPANPGCHSGVERLLQAAQEELERDTGRPAGRGERAAAWLRLGQIRLSLDMTGSTP